MLLSRHRERLAANLQETAKDAGERWELSAPTFTRHCPKTARMAHPFIGVVHRINSYSSVLETYCTRHHPATPTSANPDVGTPRPSEDNVPAKPRLLESLSTYLQTRCVREDAHVSTADQLVEYQAARKTHDSLHACPVYRELQAFLVNLSSFLNGCYVPGVHWLEPFQQQLVMHTFFFLVSIKAPQKTHQLFGLFKQYFGLFETPNSVLQTFKQKASVFLIPRRHGKTWIVVAIISMLLASVENINIGYVAHQKHVANSVFAEIIKTLCRWFPPKNLNIKKENGTIIYTRPGGRSSSLMCATCFNKNSIRGQTFNLLYVDEANFIKKDALPAILGFMLQKDAKLIFISSVNSSDRSTSFLLNLRNAQEKMLNVVSYVCADHREDFHLQDALVSCPCYRLHIPTYITIDESIKTTTNLFMEGAFDTELMGEGAASSNATLYRVVGDAALTQFDMCRVDTTAQQVQKCLGKQLFVYIDPAYTNNTEASGTGVGAVVTSTQTPTRSLILGMEHFFLRDLTGAAAYEIASCACTMIKAIAVLHPTIERVNAAVEGNSSQDSGVAIATVLNEICPLTIHFLHYTDKSSALQWPIYMLGGEKSSAFETFIYALNSGTLSASQTVVSNTIKISFDPVTYLVEQVRAIKCVPLRDGGQSYSAKQKHMSDDLLVAVVMAHFMATDDRHMYKPISPQ
ncbi:MAG: ORF29 [Human gammaherpesvirus 8]|uniref:ORF29 n=1 Tax=Human herpesvirus 8 TaxID=37296 RepID=A0A0N9SH02_HHV8|nr:ORF29 [Human gammaherpesvirus 8]QLI54362.1 ORF29 [Human gammaherpesvirus 8]QLI54450.1 ORF29 [Human gammaherpesvirus 8]QLI54539.1 ORF29 [Human gammaherpesvirus 8]QLI54628.1 ORF29 [Human gammaherpesvirus 8]